LATENTVIYIVGYLIKNTHHKKTYE